MATSGPRVRAPRPPADLARFTVQRAVTASTWFRLTRFPSPLSWSRKGLYRFDSPSAKWGVCYAAESIPAAFQEIWGDELRRRRRVDWLELEQVAVWQLEVSPSLKTIELAGETLVTIHATLQSFVSSYSLSQAWGAELMNHPGDFDGLPYLGRRSGRTCLALFGDESTPKAHQSALRVRRLGTLVTWKGLWPFLDRIQAKVAHLPSTPSLATWR